MMLHALRRMSCCPEHAEDKENIPFRLLSVLRHAAGASDLPLLPEQVCFSQPCHHPQRLKQQEFTQKQKKPKPCTGDSARKKREGPMWSRKLAHPNLCTLGGAGSEHQGPLQRMFARPAARFQRKTAEEGQLRIKQWFLSSEETFPLTSRHLGSSQHLEAERPTALFLFWQHYSE